MNECVVNGAYSFMQLLETLGMDGRWDEDIHTLLQMEETRKKCCCSEPRREAERAVESVYKKIIASKLDALKDTLLEKAKSKGFDTIRFEGVFREGRRGTNPYKKILQ